MLGKNPLATTPLATLAGGTQSISIPASLVATGSAGSVSLFYEINLNTTIVSASAFAPTLGAGAQEISIPTSIVVTGSVGSVSLAYEIKPGTDNASATAFTPALNPTLLLNGVTASASATAPSIFLSVEPTPAIVNAVATDPNLLATIGLPQPDVAIALAEQISLQALITPQTAGATAQAFDPEIVPVLSITIDAVTAQSVAVDPSLLAGLVVDGTNAVSATTENISLIPTLGLGTAAAEATSPDPQLVSNLSLQAAQTSPAIAGNLTLNLDVAIDNAALATVSSYDPQAQYSVFITPAYVIAIDQDLALSGSIFLQPVLASAAVGQIGLQYFATVDTLYSQATAIDPAVQLRVNLEPSTVALATATTPDLTPAVSPAPAITHAIASDPLLVYDVQLSSPAIAEAAAVNPAVQLGVVLDHAPSSALAGVVSLAPFVVPGPATSSALAASPLLDYDIITSVALATAAAYDPSVQCSVDIDASSVALAAATALTLFASVEPAVALSYASSTSPGLVYHIQTATALAGSQAVNPALQPTVILDATAVSTAAAVPLSAFVAVNIVAAVAPAAANSPSLKYELSLATAGSLAYSVDPHLEYNIGIIAPAPALALSGALAISRTAGDYYIDPVSGDDTNDGLSWTTAWKTMTFGATEPRTIPGDFIRIAKTTDPVAIGCLWTSGSKSVILSAPRTLGIDDCESGWTAVNGSTVNHIVANKKQGTACVGIDVPSYTPSTIYAYKTISNVDASAYQGLSFWYRVESSTVDSGRWEVCLCSDTLGMSVVDRFPLPEQPAAGRWMPLNIPRSGGGNLGASIQSIALYTTATPPSTPHVVLLDNVQATKANDLNLTSLISKDGSPTGGGEGYWGIQSISGSTVLLDRDTNCDADSGFGYYGATEDVPTYIRETYKVPPAASMLTSSLFNVNNSGTPGSLIVYSGGWNTGSNVQDGQTYYDGQNGLGVGFYVSSKNFVSASRMSFYRFGSAFYAEGECVGHDINIPNASNCSNVAVSMKDRFLLGSVVLGNVNSNGSPDISGSCGVSIDGGSMDNVVQVQRALSNQNCGVSLECANNVRLIGPGVIANNECGLRAVDCGAGIFVEDTTFDNIAVDTSNDSSRLTLVNASMTGAAVHFEHLTNYGYTQKTLSHNHNSTGANIVSHGGGLITSMVTTRPGGSGLMWRLLTTDPVRDSFNPLPLYAGQVYCVANATTTVKAWLKKDHATQVDGRLAARGRQLAGIPNNVTATLANNTGWQELSISLTPTESGVVQIEVWAEYVSGHQPVYYDQGISVQ
jgi:hypothetical protein